MIGEHHSHYRFDKKIREGTCRAGYRGIHIHDDQMSAVIKVDHP
jgi:hypothetical protein